MNGPEHYREAERLIDLADSPAGIAMKADGIDMAALAQVHATLALAAVQAANYAIPIADGTTGRGWRQIAGIVEVVNS